MAKFIDTAASRKTSPEIMEAILYVAGGNDTEAKRVWADPTVEETLAIWERVTKNGLLDSEEFCWGASGSAWWR